MKTKKLVLLLAIAFISVGAIVFFKAVLPEGRIVDKIQLDSPNQRGQVIEIELDKPLSVTEGRDASVVLRVLPGEETAKKLLIARAELAFSTTPQGEVMEVAGEDGGAVFYWNLNTNNWRQTTGRVWLYIDQDPQAVLIGALPVDLVNSKISWLGQFGLSALLITLGGLLFFRSRV